MASAVWASLIAVVGTLCGGLLGGVIQARVARSIRRESRCDARRAEAVTAVTALVSALADHRRAMWVREELRQSGADENTLAPARTASHATRSAVTAPLVTLEILVPELASVARRATGATFALRGAADHARLADLRQQAINASDQVISAAAQLVGHGLTDRPAPQVAP